jgi:leader peptidase (prepilin peptidase)/N-methyltransferase
MDGVTLGVLLASPWVGSFLGTLVLRLPEGRPVLVARSACPGCGQRLQAWEMVPLVSWLLLGRRCRHCRAPIPAFYPAMELAAMAVALWAAAETEGAALVLSALLGWALLVLAVTDRREFLLPDAVTLPLIAAGLGAVLWLDPGSLRDHAIGAALGWVGFAGLAALYRRLRGREGLGQGDAKLLAAGGAWLGWSGLPGVVLIASLLGLTEVLLLAIRRGEMPSAARRIAFGTWLAAGIWLVWLYGPLLPP